MSQTMQDDPPLPIDQRIRAAYFKARQREGTPALLLDREFQTMQARLHRLSQPAFGTVTDADNVARGKILADAETLFSKWADMPASEVSAAVSLIENPPAPPPTPQESARRAIAMFEARGLKLDAQAKTFRVAPASKLDASDKAQLQQLKAAVLAELHHRADTWSPE